MDLSITRGKAVLLVVALGAGGWWWFTKGGGELLPLPRSGETPKLGGDRESAVEGPAPRPARPTKSEPEPPPVVDDHPGAATSDPDAQPKKRERTPDEKARSSIALATGYADNGLFDKAYAALDAAEAVAPSAAVLEEVAAARTSITAAMRQKAGSLR
jgi:hypothetical protein